MTKEKSRAARWRSLLDGLSAEAVEVPEPLLVERAAGPEEAALVLVDLLALNFPGHPLKALRDKRPRLDIVVFGDEQKLFGDAMARMLEAGASDFIHDGRQDSTLENWLRRRLERSGSENSKPLEASGIRVDPAARTVELKDGSGWSECDDLTPKEFDILCLLLENSQRPVSRVELMEKIWGAKAGVVNVEAVDKQVAALRKKLGSHGKSLKTVRGVGYSLG